MKAFLFTILLGALAMYNCASCEGTASSVSDCEKLDVPEGGYRCCYVDYKVTVLGVTQEKKECDSVTKEQYDNIDSYIDNSIKQVESLGGKVDKFSVDCHSIYLIGSLLSLLLLFL